MPNRAVDQFERAFAQWLGIEHAFAFWKGRVAMYAILRGMDIGASDEVILPGYTCVMDVNPIKYCGADPVYVDIEPKTYNIDPDLLDKSITPRTKMIIAQHTYGYPCEMDAIMDVAARHGIPVVEDCCLAMGSRYRDRLCGTFGAAAYFSFQWNKPFTTGLGGMATTSDRALAGRIETLCDEMLHKPRWRPCAMLAAQRMVYRLLIFPKTTALATRLFRWLTRKGLVVGSSASSEFVPEMAEDFFTQMGPAQARAGLKHLRKVGGNIEHRRRMRSIYDELLGEAGWPLPDIPETMDPVLVRYPVRVADKQRAVAEAPRRRVELGTWFECPLHPIETPMHLYGYRQGMCPVAERACREVVNLPMHPRAGAGTARRSMAFIGTIGPSSA